MTRHHASTKPLLLTLLALAATATIVFLVLHKQPPPPIAATLPATHPTKTTAPASKPAPPYIPKLLFDILKHDLPRVAATQPFEVPLDLRNAAHYTLDGPLYFDPARQDLWITRPSAPPIAAILKKAADEQTHVTRDTVLYVHWQPTDDGNWLPNPIIATPAGPELVTPTNQHLPLPKHDYDFAHPLSQNNQIILPTQSSVVILTLDKDKLTESNHTLPLPVAGASRPRLEPIQLLQDYRGLLAFIPSTDKEQGSRGVSRYVDGQWSDLTPAQGFPEKILHLLPLLDGSLLAIVPTTPNHIDLELLTLDAAPAVNIPAITKLVESLSDPREQTRQSAFDQLTRYGPPIFPTLEKLLDDQPPEAKIRLQQLLRSKLKPTLGPFSLLNHNELQLLSRSPDGSVLFYTSAGISLPTPTDTPQLITPAWLSCRPGQPVRLLPDSLTHDLTPNTAKLTPLQSEWIATTDATGPARFFGNELVPLLPPSERPFSQILGIDRRGRWLFTKPSPAPTTLPTPSTLSSFIIHNSAFLLIDPTLPDPTPRLPAWTMEFKNATVGWDRRNYPSLKSGDTAFSLTDAEWTPLDLKSESFANTPSPFPSNTGRIMSMIDAPATSPSSQPTTSNAPQATPLFTTTDGTRYYNARTEITVVTKSNQTTTFPLPPEYQATTDPTLIVAAGHLFLFNHPGQCTRLTPTPDEAQPFSIDATFTKNIPDVDKPLRLWLDPAGRICLIPDEHHLILLFPTGRIPEPIAEKMPPDQLDAAAQ